MNSFNNIIVEYHYNLKLEININKDGNV